MRIYLAGPEVFLPDAAAIAEAKKAICARYGAVGVFPADLAAGEEPADAPRWYAIYRRNAAHLRTTDALIANLTPFRGPSADVGTVFELGFACALGRPVAAYSHAGAAFLPRTLGWLGHGGAARDATGRWRDAEGLAIEDFGLHDNLMLEGAIRAAGGIFLAVEVTGPARWRDMAAFEACVRHLMRPTPPAAAGAHSPG